MSQLKKKYFLHCFLVLLSLFILTGCSDKKSEDAKRKARGRYIETNMEIPKKDDRTSIITQKFLKDGSYVVYTADVSDSNSISITRYHYNANMSSYEVERPLWLQGVPIEGIPWDIKVLHGENDTEYLYWVDDQGASLYHSQDGKSLEKITIEGWNEQKPDGMSIEYPSQITMLDNGMIAAKMYDGSYIYELKTGKKKKRIEEDNIQSLTAFQDKLVVTKGDNGQLNIISLLIFDTENLEAAPEEIVLDKPIPQNTAVCVSNNEVILANRYGIHVLPDGTNSWQTVVEGSMSSRNIPNVICDTVLRDRENDYYVMYANDESGHRSIKKYHCGKMIRPVPSEELTIYTLEENPLLHAAAYDFQRKNKEFRVTIRVAMSEKPGLRKEDYIQSLNTELCSGNGSDLILLDGLPWDSYVEKGTLSDISSIVDPLMKKKELLTNVIRNYYKKGKIYALPLAIRLPMIYGKADAVDSSDTIDKLAAYAEETEGTPLFGAYTYNDIMEDFLPCYMHKIMTSKKRMDQENLRKFLKDIKIILDKTGYRSEYTKENRKKSVYDLPISTSLYKENTTNFFNADLNLNFMHFIDGKFTTVENSFVPVSIIGINKSSKYQDLAKEFITFLLSDIMQRVADDEMGFPVRKEALDTLEAHRYYAEDYEITYEDGTKGHVPLKAMSNSDRQKIVHYCKMVTEQAYVEDNIFKAISEGGKDYILKNESIDRAVEKIEKNLSLYNKGKYKIKDNTK